MFKKIGPCLLGLGAAAMAPMAYFTVSDSWKSVGTAISAPAGAEAVRPDEPTLPASSAALWDAAPVRDLSEVFRFDVTPGWVMQRWPRVSVGLAKPELEGYRVPLMTGTTPMDLAGALTYYFNSHQQVQEIVFYGTTGDVRRLTEMLTTRYGFARRLTNDPGLVIYEALHLPPQPNSVLRVEAAPVVKANDPRRRFVVELAIERPEVL